MLEIIGKALDWLVSPKRWAAVFIFCAVLVLLPKHFAERLGLQEVRQHYLLWISLCGIFSLTVLVVEFGAWLKTPLASLRAQRNQKAVLRSLTPPEMRIIAEYFRRQTDTQYFSATDGIAGGLSLKGLIYQSSTVSEGMTPDFAFNLQPWVVGKGDAQKKAGDIAIVYGHRKPKVKCTMSAFRRYFEP